MNGDKGEAGCGRGGSDDRRKTRPDFVGSRFQDRPQKDQGNRPAGVVPWVVDVTMTKAELLVLGQLAYWFGESANTGKVRAKIKWEGRYWVRKTYTKLALETRLTKDQVRRAVRTLVGQGLLIMAKKEAGGLNLYRIDPEAVARRVEENPRPAGR